MASCRITTGMRVRCRKGILGKLPPHQPTTSGRVCCERQTSTEPAITPFAKSRSSEGLAGRFRPPHETRPLWPKPAPALAHRSSPGFRIFAIDISHRHMCRQASTRPCGHRIDDTTKLDAFDICPLRRQKPPHVPERWNGRNRPSSAMSRGNVKLLPRWGEGLGILEAARRLTSHGSEERFVASLGTISERNL